MKIWLKNPDPSHQCCGCEGKAGPCSSCSRCTYSGISPPPPGTIYALYNISGNQGYASEDGTCFVANSLYSWSPTPHINISDYESPVARSYTNPYEGGYRYTVVDGINNVGVQINAGIGRFGAYNMDINYTIQSSSAGLTFIGTPSPSTNFNYQGVECLCPAYAGDTITISTPKSMYISTTISREISPTTINPSGADWVAAIGGDPMCNFPISGITNIHTIHSSAAPVPNSISFLFKSNQCLNISFLYSYYNPPDNDQVMKISIMDGSGNYQNPLTRFVPIPSSYQNAPCPH